MDAGLSPARQTRAQHRHELHTLIYLTLDDTNGGVVRNLTHDGIGVQVVAGVRPQQHLNVRFELRYPRLRVETRGEVVWATFSGQCGIRFLDLSPQQRRQINEWIFGDMLEAISLHADPEESMFAPPLGSQKPARSHGNGAVGTVVDDGLMVSATPVKVIALPARREASPARVEMSEVTQTELDWLSRPLSGRGLAWTVHALVVFAGILLFGLVFLAITGEAPRWPIPMVGGATVVIAGLYWIFFQIFGGTSLGTRLARLAGYGQEEEEESGARFR
jgi:PilZ domain-containing protein